MISITGNILLLLTLTTSFASITTRGMVRIYCFYLACLLPPISFLLLLIGFISDDFELRNVFLNSSSELPVIYKIAASWASHEGSILLWYSFLGVISFAYVKLLSKTIYVIPAEAGIQKQNKLLDSRLRGNDVGSGNDVPSIHNIIDFGITIFAFIQVLFISFIIFTSNPFDSFSFVSSEGIGLNPVLQDVALSIHPPILYLGNVCYAAIFTGSLMLLYKPQDTKTVLDLSKKFSSLGLMLLTGGIGLGSWWAYRELGWGGYWFFDPVENISLLPWLSGIALHHFLVIFQQRGKFLNWVIILSILNFLLILYGTFIVRSGIISSVHSFAFSPQRGLFIFLICITLTMLSFFWFFLKKKNLKKLSFPRSPLSFPRRRESSLIISLDSRLRGNDRGEISLSPMSIVQVKKESLILLGNIFWLAALASLVIALIYPIYCALVEDIDVAIDPDYFHTVFVPIFIPIAFLASITPNLSQKITKHLVVFAMSVIITALLYLKIELDLISSAICFASIFLMLNMVSYIFVERGKLTGRKYALFLGHFGSGLLALAIAVNCAGLRQVEFIGKIGDEANKQDLTIKLEDVKFSEGVNYFRQIAIFRIEDEHNNVVILKPENRLYKIEKTLSQEVDIYSFISHDLYAVLSQIDKNTIHARIYYQPAMSFIWLSVLVITAGFFISFLEKRSRSIW